MLSYSSHVHIRSLLTFSVFVLINQPGHEFDEMLTLLWYLTPCCDQKHRAQGAYNY